MGRFVRDYLTRYNRAQSPKFILGESYGTTRAAALIDWLQQTAGISVKGALLISSALDFQTISFRPHDGLAYVLALPTYAATAWYHEKLPGSLTDVVQQAEQWARTEYLVALAKGAAITDAERARIAERLERYTGLHNEALQRRLRVGPRTFARELLQSTSRVVGRFDSRVTASAASDAARETETDPSFSGLIRQLRETLIDYMRSDLQYRTDLRYVPLSHEASRSWQWTAGGQGYLYVADELAEAMARDRGLRVFAAAGYYDLATPYAAQKYTFEQMELEPELRRNLTFVGYPAGHQIYTDPAAAAKLKTDVQKFVQCAVEEGCD
jgi:carboxypeptidase C (cathepsin A)